MLGQVITLFLSIVSKSPEILPKHHQAEIGHPQRSPRLKISLSLIRLV